MTTSTAADADKRRTIIALLSKLALHYWRPDFTAGQAKQLIEDYVDDLASFPLASIEAGITAVRQSKADFFPRIPELRDAIIAAMRDTARAKAATPETQQQRGQEFGESRPLMWWLQRREWWKPHWSTDDIPINERQPYFNWINAKQTQPQP